MKVIVPISNLSIDRPFNLCNIRFEPELPDDIYLGIKDVDPISYYETEEGEVLNWNLRDMNTFVTDVDIEEISNMTLAIFDFDYNYEDLYEHSHEDDLMLISRISEKVDRALDVIRVHYCNVNNLMTCPGISGLLPNGYSAVIALYPDDEANYRILTGKIYGSLIVGGIGLSLEDREIFTLMDEEKFSKIVSDQSNDYVPLTCRNALKRLSEAMYIPNVNSKFIYLMTTLETIASPKYLAFQKVKGKLLPFISESKKQYDELSDYMRFLSEDLRTEVVHNGKDLIQIRGAKYKTDLFNIQSFIVRCVDYMYSSACKSIDELESYRTELRKKLGV
ncbi:hypothetical protein [Brevibacillus laterosporus]|uniref:Uncharacterized protein n=1 Tax=Brevibacillus laterosporus TaxID=1465 RepID=A0AAP8U6C6_BRELA|nr:hypothetical protein [Brevibacillus laterosporus]PPB08843.1 hypothetical protein C4A77_06030 [Brevibacillus laterosporus]